MLAGLTPSIRLSRLARSLKHSTTICMETYIKSEMVDWTKIGSSTKIFIVSLGRYSEVPALQETGGQTTIAILRHAPEHGLGSRVLRVSAQI